MDVSEVTLLKYNTRKLSEVQFPKKILEIKFLKHNTIIFSEEQFPNDAQKVQKKSENNKQKRVSKENQKMIILYEND